MANEKKGRGRGASEGMKAGETGMGGELNENSVRKIINKGDFHSWNDVITWLDQNGQRDPDLNPGQTMMVKNSFQQLRDDGAEFTRDPNRILQLVRQHRR